MSHELDFNEADLAALGHGTAGYSRSMTTNSSASSLGGGAKKKKRNWLGRKLMRKTGDVNPDSTGAANTFTIDTLGDELNNPFTPSLSDSALRHFDSGSGLSTNETNSGRSTPARCRHNLPDHRHLLSVDSAGASSLGVPEGMGRQISTSGNIPGIRVHLRKGEDLFPTDKTGLSDPFCKFSLGKSKYKSKVKAQTLNPMWSEEFFLPCAEDCQDPIYLEVLDKDMLGTDFMGQAFISTSGLLVDQPRDITVELEAGSKKNMPKNLGTIFLTVTRAFEFSKKERKARKKEGFGEGRLVTIDVVEGRELCPMDDNGLADPYVKIKLGKHKLKTKTASKTLYPTWRQRFEVQLHDQSQIVSFTVLDKDDFGDDDFMGQCEVNLAEIGMEHTFEAWLPLDDQEDAGELHVMITVADLYADASTVNLNDKQRFKYPGKLTLEVIRAKKLEVKDMSTSDPFVVVELGNTRLRTVTMHKNLNPEYNKVFEIPVKDIFACASITVYDEDKGGKQEFMGCVTVPLLEAPTTPTWYPLKDARLMSRHKGEILLRFKLTYKTLPACKGLIERRETKHMAEEEKFRVQLLKLHMGRVVKLLKGVVGFVQTVNGLFAWQYGFFKSFIAMIFWIIGSLYLELWMVPIMLSCGLAYNYAFNNNSRVKYSADGEVMDIGAYEDDEGLEEEEEEEEDEPKKGLREKWQTIKTIGQTIQNVMDKIASHGESVKNLANWSVPLITQIVMIVLFVAGIALRFLPLRFLLIAWGVKRFVSKGLYAYGILKRPKWWQPTSAPEELLNRVPSDIELMQRRRLQPLRDGQLKRRGPSRKG